MGSQMPSCPFSVEVDAKNGSRTSGSVAWESSSCSRRVARARCRLATCRAIGSSKSGAHRLLQRLSTWLGREDRETGFYGSRCARGARQRFFVPRACGHLPAGARPFAHDCREFARLASSTAAARVDRARPGANGGWCISRRRPPHLPLFATASGKGACDARSNDAFNSSQSKTASVTRIDTVRM